MVSIALRERPLDSIDTTDAENDNPDHDSVAPSETRPTVHITTISTDRLTRPTTSGERTAPSRHRLRAVHPARVPATPRDPQAISDARARVVDHNRPGSTHLVKLIRGVPSLLVAADVAAVLVESALIGWVQGQALIFAVAVLGLRSSTHQYRQRLALSALDDVPRILGSAVAATGVTLAAVGVFWRGPLPARELIARAGLFVAIALVLQILVFVVAGRVRRRSHIGRRTLIIGGGPVGRTLGDAMLEHPELGLAPVGLIDPDGDGRPGEGDRLPLLASDMTHLAALVRSHEVDTAILAFKDAGDDHVDTIINLHQAGCTLLIVPSMFELHQDGPDVERVRGIPLHRLRPDPTLRPTWWVKRAIDITVATVALALMAVPFLAIALLILIDSGRPILFWQERVGLDGHTFRLCKFRSLRPRSESEQQTTWNIADDPRVGKVGHFLRRTSIDELPQLWNIVRGQMSLVGPRPERPTFVQQFAAEHERYWARHRVPVGLTGLAQVNGLRGDTSIRERARYDNYYIANWSLWLDVKVVLLTIREVLGGHGR